MFLHFNYDPGIKKSTKIIHESVIRITNKREIDKTKNNVNAFIRKVDNKIS